MIPKCLRAPKKPVGKNRSANLTVVTRFQLASEPTKALNTRLPESLVTRLEDYLKATPSGLVHGAKTALIQSLLADFLENTGY